jgi:hypothetical protein
MEGSIGGLMEEPIPQPMGEPIGPPGVSAKPRPDDRSLFLPAVRRTQPRRLDFHGERH